MNNIVRDTGFFTEDLSDRDPELFDSIKLELGRQRDEIELIASENIVSELNLIQVSYKSDKFW